MLWFDLRRINDLMTMCTFGGHLPVVRLCLIPADMLRPHDVHSGQDPAPVAQLLVSMST
jgi:hypothetical protein